jgi:hypothetical protein
MSLLHVYFYGKAWTSLNEHIPKKILPDDCGGEVGSRAVKWDKIHMPFPQKFEASNIIIISNIYSNRNKIRYICEIGI